MQRRQVLFSIGLVVLLTVLTTGVAWGKGHVPAHKVQVCHRGETNTVSANALQTHLNHGDGQLPACDFANIFHTGDPCNAAVVNGKAVLNNTPNRADGLTPACPGGVY